MENQLERNLGVLEIFAILRRVYVEFFGYTPHIHAGAAHIAILGDGNPGAEARCHAGCPDTARTGTNDKKVKVPVGHGLSQTLVKGQY